MEPAAATVEGKKNFIKSGARRFYLINTIKFWGGGERFIFDLASGLRGRGHDVRVYGRPGKELVRRAEGAGLAAVSLRMHYDYDPLPLLKFPPASEQDVFLAVAPRDLKLLRLMTLLRTKAKLFWYLGVCYPEDNREYHWLLKNERIQLIAVCEYLKSEIVSRLPQVANRISILPSGVETPAADPEAARQKLAERYGIPPHRFFLGMFSRLVPGKGHSMIFEALRRVREKGRDFHLWVLGTGEEERLGKEVAQTGLADRVTFAGYQTDVTPWMAGVDAVLLPSEKESFPYVVLEAMALGKTVLASNVGGLPEMIQNGKDGILLPHREVEAWASAIIELAQNAQTKTALGEAARRSVKEQFSQERMISRFLEIVHADSAVGRP